ncbi:CYTH and CHAD domain-containing protein [Methylobacterium sp. Leaf118]|uniref:CYTH and CHAD domain-containing protein n=1 Tax=Methylobacterium sp. Leaf118 TaxID=2876562 RepID=UPI001E5654D6|nr:CHAD domain-containing protein [Methylobacterium sp. Leaf118]
MSSLREIALTLDCEGPDLLALAAHPLLHAPEERAVHLQATGYDTDAGDLRAAGFALLVSQEAGPDGERIVQTVQAGPGTRWERAITGPDPDHDALAETPVAEVLERADAPALAARFSTRLERTQRTIRYGASAITVTLDRGRIESPNGEAPVGAAALALTEGEAVDLFALAQALAETVPLRLARATGDECGWALAEGRLHRPSKPGVVTLDPEASAGEAFAAIARACLRHLRVNEAVLRQGRDPEALHQVRVALRRLRSAFTLFRPILAGDATAEVLRDEVKRVTEPFGRARNLDVFLAETLAPEIERRPDDPGLHDLRALVGGAREAAHDAVAAILHSPAWRGLMIDLVAWIEAGPWRGAGGPAERDGPARDFAATMLERLRRRVRTRGRRLDRLEPEARHRVRIEAKKLRYGAEFFAALYADDRKAAKRHRAFVAALAALQDQLGALNDIATAHAIRADLTPPDRPGVAGFPDDAVLVSAGLVAADVEARSDARLRAAARAHAAFAEARPFWR